MVDTQQLYSLSVLECPHHQWRCADFQCREKSSSFSYCCFSLNVPHKTTTTLLAIRETSILLRNMNQTGVNILTSCREMCQLGGQKRKGCCLMGSLMANRICGSNLVRS